LSIVEKIKLNFYLQGFNLEKDLPLFAESHVWRILKSHVKQIKVIGKDVKIVSPVVEDGVLSDREHVLLHKSIQELLDRKILTTSMIDSVLQSQGAEVTVEMAVVLNMPVVRSAIEDELITVERVMKLSADAAIDASIIAFRAASETACQNSSSVLSMKQYHQGLMLFSQPQKVPENMPVLQESIAEYAYL